MKPVSYIIFGVTSDLSRSKLIASAFHLWADKKINNFIGVGRKELLTIDFEKLLRDALTPSSEKEQINEFITASRYFRLNYEDPQSYSYLKKSLDQNALWIFHLALPPDLFLPTLKLMAVAQLQAARTCNSHFLIEKPFGYDSDSARELITQTKLLFPEEQMYRVDHYLGKGTVRNIIPFRLRSSGWESIWNHNYINHIQIIAAESEGVGSRGNYYDKVGAIRDMVQSHCLELLTIAAMELSNDNDPELFRQCRVDVLRHIRTKEVTTGQYEGYHDENNVNPHSLTETFVTIKAELDKPPWQNTPITIKTGKKLKEKKTSISIGFKPKVKEEIEKLLPISYKHLTYKNDSRILEINIDTGTSFGSVDDAYINLITDCIASDQSFFVRDDEVLAAWEGVKPALVYAKNHKPEIYRQDSID